MKRHTLGLQALAWASLAFAPSCASSPHAQLGVSRAAAIPPSTLALMGAPTSETEREGRISAADKPLNPKAVKSAFWGGIITGSVGGAMTLGFGAAGAVTSNRLTDSFGDGLTYDDRDARVSRGETYNALAITGASLFVTGMAVAAITYAVDSTRCGPMRQKRESCTPQ